MRRALTGICVMAALLFAPMTARAQLDDEDPIPAGQITEEAARGRRLFDAGRFGESAAVLKSVMSGETGDARGTRQLAQYHLAVALYRLRFYQASVAIFSDIAEHSNHPRYNEALPWLAKLATELPEPADVIERVGKYKAKTLARFNNPEQRELYWQLNYLLGRYKYRNRIYDDAIRLFGNVDPKSKHYVEAQLFIGTAYMQIRKSAPAIGVFQRVVRAIDEDAESPQEKAQMRSFALHLMARTHSSAAIHLRPKPTPKLNTKKQLPAGK